MATEPVVMYQVPQVSPQGDEPNWTVRGTETMGAVSATTISTSVIRSASKITVDPAIREGLPCVGLAQVPAATILKYLAQGLEPEKIVIAIPGLAMADIHSALSAAAWVMRDPSIDWDNMNLPEMLGYQDELWAWDAASNSALSNLDE